MRLVEIRLLEGPNVFRLEPAVKIEIALGRRRTWHGARLPRNGREPRIGAVIGRADWPVEVDHLVAWLGRLRRASGDSAGAPHVRRASPWPCARRGKMTDSGEGRALGVGGIFLRPADDLGAARAKAATSGALWEPPEPA